ncbi:NAD-dependent succinate-semialdehyde dehydrogenase [Pseudomonas citrulli]|uniref:NAD-dependent succinate-semialdehyde dehydrogenase n=1 Tax=Pseudomonas citrulli TaxID=3064347 RepID=A0ABT9BZ88_9PSED|nr:NAD-dependent succinate-semialdehyde dehydrogenase [Pseudomonas sp. K18]MDO7896174.1 NAD-dependent succinate-semialdehyde dehydrogenase [Pseudomonas sp. K18]
MYKDIGLFINGQWRYPEGDRPGIDIINPSDHQRIGRVACADHDDLDHALQAAQQAFTHWKVSSAETRSKVLYEAYRIILDEAESIAALITLDQGKPLAEALAEVRFCAEHAKWHAEECKRLYGRLVPARNPKVRQSVVKRPVGVCCAFTPWNFPFNQAIRKICAALGAGCTLILKGPEEAPSAVAALADIFQRAGLPDGCLNLVWGDPERISSYLIDSDVIAKVSFTGSIAVGKKLAAQAGAKMKRVSMELGGHAAVIVCPSSNIDKVSSVLVDAKFRNAGQICISPSRFFVHASVIDDFMTALVEKTRRVQVGDGMAPETRMGPLCNARQIPRLQALVDDSLAQGASLVMGGRRLDRPGNYFPPTILANVPLTARLMQEEPFGPVVPVVAFSDLDSVIDVANGLPYGLAAYGFSEDRTECAQLADGLEAGMISINHYGLGMPETPFGGIKDSGYGSEGGSETYDSYLSTVLISELTRP